MILKVIIPFLLLISFGCQKGRFITKDWHTKIREYQLTNSVLFPIVEYKKIKKVKIGYSLDDIKKEVGFEPVKYYIHPGYALLATEVMDKTYEVAFKYNDKDIVTDISFKELNP